MPSVAQGLRVPKMPTPDSDDNPYVQLVLAIVARAVQDAQGHCWSPGPQSPEQIQAEARRWLQDDAQVATLVELAGLDAEPVLRRIRRILATGARGD